VAEEDTVAGPSINGPGVFGLGSNRLFWPSIVSRIALIFP